MLNRNRRAQTEGSHMLTRRSFGLLAAASAMARTMPAWAQSFPERPVRMLLGFPPGGTVDTVARIIGPPLSERLGQPVIIENRSGAAGVLAVDAAVHAPPDGHTIVFASAGALVIIPHMQASMRYDPFADLAPISRVVGTPMLLVVGKHVAANSARELQAFAKANPGKLTYGSTGNGSSLHLAGELFKMRAGVDILHVPYRGGAPAVTGLLAGEIDMLLTDIPVVLPHVQSGAFKSLGLASDQRSPILPDVPTVTEAGIAGVIAEGWYAMYAPAGTPATAINTLQAALADVLAQNAVKQAIIGIGGVVQSSSPAELTAYQRAEYAKWGEVVRVSGAKMN
jgi:tripartite-type tricarboxylate transporter receptor subunit TctC